MITHKALAQKVAQLEAEINALKISAKYQQDPFFCQWVELQKMQMQGAQDIASTDLEIRWNCLWAFVGEAIRHERIVQDLIQKHNDSVLWGEAVKKDRAEIVGKLSAANDTIDSLTFEANQVRRDLADVTARSQRQAARITDLETQIENLKHVAELVEKLDAIRSILK